MALKFQLGRSLASFLMLGVAGYLCLATSPVPDPPTAHAKLDVPMAALESTKRVRVLMAGANVSLSVAPSENVQVTVESASVPLEMGDCWWDYSSSILCMSNPDEGFAELIVRIDRALPATEPGTITVSAGVQSGSPKDVPSDLVSVHAYGIDLELLP